MKKNILKKMMQKKYLPTIRELKIAFPRKKSHKTDSAEFPLVNPEFTKFFDIHNTYQVYTKEFITSLARYLTKQIAGLGQPVTILEVGAGDGRLSTFLRESPLLNKKVRLVATDSKEWEKKGDTNKSSKVLKMNYSSALEKFARGPTIVVSCWMNIDVNWTADFRKFSQIKEYILIGDVLRTAGYGAGWYLPPKSGFTCVKLSRNQRGERKGVVVGSVGRFDGSPFNPESRTEVYSFRRKK